MNILLKTSFKNLFTLQVKNKFSKFSPLLVKSISTNKVSFSPKGSSNEKICSSLIVSKFGDPFKQIELVETEIKNLKENQILVKMIASPVNPADINIIQGVYPIKSSPPVVLGIEGYGKVIEVGSKVKNVSKDDRVISGTPLLGTWRTHVICEAKDLVVISKELDTVSAATLMINPCSAYRMLKDFVTLEENDLVVQNASNGTVGRMVIQICNHLKIKTINIIRDRSDVKVLTDELKGLGADIVVTEEMFRSPEMKGIMKNLDPPKLCLNAVGGKGVADMTRYMPHEGTIVTYGGMSKVPLMVPTAPLIFKNIKVLGFWMTRWTIGNSGSVEQKQMIDELSDLFVKKILTPPPFEFLLLKDYQKAVERTLESKRGKKQIYTFEEGK